MSPTIINNRSGPNTEPCLTPNNTSLTLELVPSITTLWVLPVRKQWILLTNFPVMPNAFRANPAQTRWSCQPSNLRSWRHSIYRVVLVRKAYDPNIRPLTPILFELWGQVILRSSSTSLFRSIILRSNIILI